MSKKKAFLLGFSLTLAVLVPVYLAVCAYGLSRTAPVEQKQQGVPVVQPLSTDARTLALMTGEGGPQTFVLVRFDAYEGRITTAALDAQTVVLCGGQGMTLFEVAQQMGPAGVTAALEETLGAPVDNYIYCTARRLASLTENFGSAQLKLTNYMTSEALGELQLSVPGVSELTLSTQVLCETLEAQALSRDAQTLLRAQGYLAFARAASGQLEQKAANAMRAAVAELVRATTMKGEVPPFIMELPAYHVPQPKNLVAHLWDKTKHFVKKAFTIILASTILIWFISHFSWNWEYLEDAKMDKSILAGIGGLIQPLFTPLGFGSQLKNFGWVFAVAAITGLIAKENVIATFGTLAACIVGGMIDVEADGGIGAVNTMIAATGIDVAGLIAFIAFNMLTIPCFAAVATAKAELPNKKSFNMTLLFWIATSYIVSMMIYLIGAWWWTCFIFAAIWAAIITLIVLDNKGKINMKKFFQDLAGKLKIKKNA